MIQEKTVNFTAMNSSFPTRSRPYPRNKTELLLYTKKIINGVYRATFRIHDSLRAARAICMSHGNYVVARGEDRRRSKPAAPATEEEEEEE